MSSTKSSDRLICYRYRLNEVLGRGGMGTVWRARDVRLERDVAVKEVRLPDEIEGEDRSALEARALREARAAAKLSQPSVVTVFDVQQEDGRVYLVMELVDGPSLADLVARDGPVTVARATDVALDVLSALEAAHAAGIVHRDVKPGNIMLPPGGNAKLADFGIASLKDDPKITKTGLILGSPAYMAPEQVKGGAAEPATDLWALGATLYYAVEGRPPFEKGQAIPTLAAVVDDEPPPMRRAGSMEPMIRELLNKDPGARPTIPELRRRLDAGDAPLPAGAPDPGIETATTAVLKEPSSSAPGVEPRPAPARARPTPAQRRSRLGSAMAAAALLLVVAAVAAYSLLGGEESPRGGSGAGNARVQKEDKSGPGSGSDEGASAEADPSEADPEGFATYEDPVGFSVAYPEGWQVEPDSLGDGSSTDFTDPETGAYLRVDWQSPPGDDAVQAWEDQEETFAAEHEGYERIGEIEKYGFKGSEGAWWEFSWEEGGTRFHAVDLGFIVRDEYGFALNFVAPEEEWDDLQDEFGVIQESFTEPPA